MGAALLLQVEGAVTASRVADHVRLARALTETGRSLRLNTTQRGEGEKEDVVWRGSLP